VGASATVTALAGCLGGGGGSSDSVTLTLIAHGGTTQEGEEAMMEQWAEQHDDDITIQGQAVSNNIEVMSTISENPSEYDLASSIAPIGVAMHDIQFDGGIFEEAQIDRVPNYTENIREVWRSEENPLMIDNPWGMMGYQSSQGMAYHADHVDSPTSWADAKTDDLKVSHFDQGMVRFVNCAAAAGIDPEEALQDDDLYDQVWDEVREQHEYVDTYWASGDEFMRLYREESAHIGSGWGGRIAVLQEDGHNVDYVLPEEGAFPGGACWCVVDDSENKDHAYDFLNWLYQRENVVELNQNFGYPYPITDPPEEVTSLPDYFEEPSELTQVNIRNVVPHLEDLAQDFAEVKQG
jgi:spermidine/putrescine-binding protein